MTTRIGVIKGNGIGPEITAVTQRVLESTGIPIEWVPLAVGTDAIKRFNHPLPRETISAMAETKVCLKAPLIANKLEGRITCIQPDGKQLTYPSLNNAIRRECRHFVNPRPIRGYPGISGRHADLDIVVMREVTEDIYIGHEHSIGDDEAAEAIKLITRAAATKVARYSFEYARSYGRKRVTCLHKANVLNLTDGLFLRCFLEVAREYADIKADDMMIDAACYTVVKDPARFDVVVCPNQYGDIFSDLVAGLAGSLGLAPGMNIGDDGVAMFEASHGAAPDIAGKGVANPIALVLSGALLLDFIGKRREGEAVKRAVLNVLARREVLTVDLGGDSSTEDIGDAICKEVLRILGPAQQTVRNQHRL